MAARSRDERHHASADARSSDSCWRSRRSSGMARSSRARTGLHRRSTCQRMAVRLAQHLGIPIGGEAASLADAGLVR
ncbi:MAG: hypothetical protein R3C32_01910 [Chloroflexota bacterium]